MQDKATGWVTSPLTFGSSQAEQESLTMYTCKPSQSPRDSFFRVSDTGYFASKSGATEDAEEDVSSSADEASDDPPDGHIDPPGDHIDPPGDHIDPPGDHVDPPGDHIDPPGDHVDRPGQVCLGDTVANSKGQEDRRKRAESAGSTEAENEDKTTKANGKTGASETKRTSNAVPGQSKAMTVGATAQKQGTRANVKLKW